MSDLGSCFFLSSPRLLLWTHIALVSLLMRQRKRAQMAVDGLPFIFQASWYGESGRVWGTTKTAAGRGSSKSSFEFSWNLVSCIWPWASRTSYPISAMTTLRSTWMEPLWVLARFFLNLADLMTYSVLLQHTVVIGIAYDLIIIRVGQNRTENVSDPSSGKLTTFQVANVNSESSLGYTNSRTTGETMEFRRDKTPPV